MLFAYIGTTGVPFVKKKVRLTYNDTNSQTPDVFLNPAPQFSAARRRTFQPLSTNNRKSVALRFANWLLLWALCSFATSFSFADELLGITMNNELVRIDQETGVATLIGNLDSDMSPFGLAFRGNSLYTLDQRRDYLRELDPNTGATLNSIDFNRNFSSEGALAFRPSDGLGYIAEADGDFYDFDITVPTSSRVTSGLPFNINGLAFNSNDVLYGVTGSGLFYLINENNGGSTLRGNLGIGSGSLTGGMDFDSEANLFLVHNDNLYLIDVANVSATLVTKITGFDEISGIAFVPISEPSQVFPVSYAVSPGTDFSGGVPELLASDDQYLVLDPEFLAFRYQLQLTVSATSPSATPSAVQFSYESRTFNLVGNVEQEIELFDYDAGQFVAVDTRLTSPTDTVVDATPPGDPTRFVEKGTNAVQTRISYQNSLPFWVFNTQNLYLPYRVRVDQIFWSISP